MLESRIEDYFCEKAEQFNCYAPKWGSQGHPDRSVFAPGGRIFMVELKRPFGGRLTRLQQRVFPKIEARGITVHKLRTFADVDAFFYETVGT